jgi:hypothetical protein
MVAQLESYQREHGLTFMDGSWLALFKPDIATLRREIEALPEFPEIAELTDDLWQQMTGEPPWGARKSVPRNG